MTDFNTTDASTAAATVTAPQAAVRRQTRKSATYRITVLEARIAKSAASVAADQAELDNLREILPTLPEAAEPVAGAVYTVGQKVEIVIGREANRRQVGGIVAGVQFNEANVPARYKVEVGTGFDAEFHTVYPGSVLGLSDQSDIDADAAGEGFPSDDDVLADVGGDGYAAAAAFAAADGTQDF